MVANTKLIIVDDTDLTIQYNGPWFLATGTHNNSSVSTTPFQNTLHGVNVNASFSYSFRGSQIRVFGAADGAVLVGGYNDPDWACFIDGHSISTGQGIPVLPRNNWQFCENSAMSDTVHNLTVQVTVRDSSNTFWVDALRYLPAVDTQSDNVTALVARTDPSIQYGPGWKTTRKGLWTQLSGAKVAFEFVGVRITWIGMRMNASLASTSATYSIDGDTPVSVPLPKLSSSLPDPSYLQTIFQTAPVSFGKHLLEVVYNGNAQTTPLSLQLLIIQNSTIAASSPNTTSVVGPTDLPSSLMLKGRSKSLIGSVVGGVLGIFTIIAVLVLLLLHQRSKRKPKIKRYAKLDFASLTVHPFDASAPEREPLMTEKRPPANRISARPILIQTTGKVVRTDGIPETVGVVSREEENTAPIQNGLPPVPIVHHENSGLRLPEGEEALVVELPPLYTVC